ncbi:hypothetical protein [Methylibium sp.]|jgi:hypothetical protein|uniref:hypothetical protein n=1 Tax=Methylibium sp. TaxID=2067992 RepID=UPI003D12A9BF
MHTRLARFLRCSVVALVTIGAASLSRGEAGASDTALRERLSTERRQVERDYAAQERECAQRFLVTACVDAAKVQRRDALKRLSTREAALDDAERTRRAAARQQHIDAKLDRQVRDREERASAPLIPFEAASAAIRTPARTTARAPASIPPIDEAQRRADEQRSRTEYETRQRQVEARQRAAAQRQAQRAGSRKPPAAPLPPIEGASAP